MKVINVGKVNDATVYAHAEINGAGQVELIPLGEVDREYLSTDYLIRCDSGVYPGVTDVDAHVCCMAESLLRRAIA